jgi:hypothetical protein
VRGPRSLKLWPMTHLTVLRRAGLLGALLTLVLAAGAASAQAAYLSRPYGLVAPGSQPAISWNDVANPSSSDWIGLYKAGAPDGSYLAWIYTGGGRYGTKAFPIPRGIAAGDYELRMFSNNGFTRIAWMHLGIVHPGYGSTIWNTYGQNAVPGKPLSVSWSGIVAPSSSDWVGLYKCATNYCTTGHGSYLAYKYTGGASAGRMDFPMPAGLTPGLYQLRLFTNNSYTLMTFTNIGVR